MHDAAILEELSILIGIVAQLGTWRRSVLSHGSTRRAATPGNMGAVMTRHISCAAVSVLVTMAVACDAQQAQSDACQFKGTQSLDAGLTVYKASDGELCGSYRSGDSAVHFQAFRGEDLVVGVNTMDPDAPAYTVSVRILGSDGNPIAVALGGDDEERVSGWLDQVEGLDKVGADLVTSFALAQEGVRVLSQTVGSGFEEELKILKRRSFTAAPSDSDAKTARATTWRYWIRIFRKDALFNGNPADHSSVIVNVTKPDGTILNYVTCNHGTCADDPKMQFKCQKVVYPASQRPFGILPCDSVSSYGFGSGKHVCNDDTLVQYNMVVFGSTNLSTCTDSALRTWSPNCL